MPRRRQTVDVRQEWRQGTGCLNWRKGCAPEPLHHIPLGGSRYAVGFPQRPKRRILLVNWAGAMREFALVAVLALGFTGPATAGFDNGNGLGLS